MNHVKRDPVPAGRCNGAVAVPLDEARGQAMIAVERVGERFDVRLVDRRNDHDARDAPGRVARMMVRELLRGRFPGPPGIAGFENAGGSTT
jgi:GTP cyclohydrolase I